MTATGGDVPRDAVTDPVQVVRAFLAALEDLDIDGALALVAPEIVYQNVPLPPARGLAAFGKQMGYLGKYCTRFEATVHHIAADGGSVLTERTDVIERGSFRAGVLGVRHVRGRGRSHHRVARPVRLGDGRVGDARRRAARRPLLAPALRPTPPRADPTHADRDPAR